MKSAIFFALLKRHKAAVGSILGLALIIPILEAAALSIIYLLISPEKAAKILQKGFALWGGAPPEDTTAVRWMFFAVVVAVVLGLGLGRWFYAKLGARVRYSIFEDMVGQLVRRLLDQSVHHSSREDKDNFANLVVNEGGTLAVLFFAWIQIAFASLAIIILSVSTMLYTHLLLMVIALGIGALSTLINRTNLRNLRSIGSDKVTSQKDLLREVRQLMEGLHRIKLDALEDFVLNRLQSVVHRSRSWRVAKSVTRANVANLADAFNLGSIAFLVLVGTVFFQIDPGVFVVLLLLVNRLRTNVVLIQEQIMTMRELSPGAALVQETLDRLAAGKREPARPAQGLREIRFQEVDFSYDRQEVLSGVSFDLELGDRVLLRGPSGQGKSTLLKMLAGLLPPKNGSARFRDQDGWHELRLGALRDRIFFCDSDLFLFPGSLTESLDPIGQATQEEIFLALSNAGLASDIELMPQGVASQVGENGSALSQGQRQRLLLARLFLRQPSMIILDEATANLDVDKERLAVQNLLDHIGPDTILVVATHRQGMPVDFTKVWDMRDGRLDTNSAA
ncbi:MAG: ABC transporter ATP-binding protein/permease [Desulfarculaceae bacterium]|nr:ABC transporter ATP-binding protein/permease [Desulfarculaceae bacterium]MCF8072106.1 ABC transporter ATP-binding protein/permease [Desulfarculaceae bacterium]MCF8100027.1 ABC transporter ATP-binding protein/permease [Desulfarculaceae bacterium]